MATPLHDIDALVALAEGPPGPAQSWAASRLAVMAPARFHRFPSGEDTFDEVFAAAPPRLIPALIEAFPTSGTVPLGLAASAAALGAYGALPEVGSEDRSALIAAYRGALRQDGSHADLWLAYGLSLLGDLTLEDLGAASRVEAGDRVWLLPALALRLAEKAGKLETAASDVAKALLERAHEPHLLPAILAALGAPTGPDLTDVKDPLEAARLGAEAAGATPPPLPVRKGSRARHLQSLVLSLVDKVEGAPAALLRALFAEEADLRWGLSPVAVAAWLATFTPGDPVDDVLHKTGGADPDRLSAARRAVTPAHREAIVEVMKEKGGSAVGVLAIPLVPEDPKLAYQVCDLLNVEARKDIRVEALACVSALHCADHVPVLLNHVPSRDMGLLLAEWTPTVEVLGTLIDMPIPAGREARIQYTWCLASMGDSAAVPRLAELLAEDPDGDLDQARGRAEAILQLSLG